LQESVDLKKSLIFKKQKLILYVEILVTYIFAFHVKITVSNLKSLFKG